MISRLTRNSKFKEYEFVFNESDAIGIKIHAVKFIKFAQNKDQNFAINRYEGINLSFVYRENSPVYGIPFVTATRYNFKISSSDVRNTIEWYKFCDTNGKEVVRKFTAPVVTEVAYSKNCRSMVGDDWVIVTDWSVLSTRSVNGLSKCLTSWQFLHNGRPLYSLKMTSKLVNCCTDYNF